MQDCTRCEPLPYISQLDGNDLWLYLLKVVIHKYDKPWLLQTRNHLLVKEVTLLSSIWILCKFSLYLPLCCERIFYQHLRLSSLSYIAARLGEITHHLYTLYSSNNYKVCVFGIAVCNSRHHLDYTSKLVLWKTQNRQTQRMELASFYNNSWNLAVFPSLAYSPPLPFGSSNTFHAFVMILPIGTNCRNTCKSTSSPCVCLFD